MAPRRLCMSDFEIEECSDLDEMLETMPMKFERKGHEEST